MSPAHVPLPVGDPIPPGVAQLVQQAKTGRLVLYIGAGVSAAPPSNGPMGPAVADRLRHVAAGMLGCPDEDLAADTLEEIASKIERLGGDQLFRLRTLAASAFEFTSIEPNYGHRVIAMLMREGLAKAITVNWDCGVERAGLQLGISIAEVTSVLSAHLITDALPLYKVHGSSTTPDSLKITRADVDTPQEWAVAEVRAALTSGTIVFVGLATVGDYVSDPIERVLREWSGFASAIRVVAPALPPSWAAILGEYSDASHFAKYSDDFFDDVLRALTQDCLTHVDARAQNLAAREAWATPMAEGACALASAAQGVPADQFLSWWRDGVSSLHSGRPFVTDEWGQNALLAVAYLAGLDGAIEVGGRGRRFTVRTPSQYLEIIYRPRAHLTDVMSIALDRTARRWDDGAYEDARTVSCVVVGAVGRFPAFDAVLDIAGADDMEDDISTDMYGPVRFVSAEDALQGRLAV